MMHFILYDGFDINVTNYREEVRIKWLNTDTYDAAVC